MRSNLHRRKVVRHTISGPHLAGPPLAGSPLAGHPQLPSLNSETTVRLVVCVVLLLGATLLVINPRVRTQYITIKRACGSWVIRIGAGFIWNRIFRRWWKDVHFFSEGLLLPPHKCCPLCKCCTTGATERGSLEKSKSYTRVLCPSL